MTTHQIRDFIIPCSTQERADITGAESHFPILNRFTSAAKRATTCDTIMSTAADARYEFETAMAHAIALHPDTATGTAPADLEWGCILYETPGGVGVNASPDANVGGILAFTQGVLKALNSSEIVVIQQAPAIGNESDGSTPPTLLTVRASGISEASITQSIESPASKARAISGAAPNDSANLIDATYDDAYARIADFLFDLSSGEINQEIAERFTAREVYHHVFDTGSLTFEVDGEEFTVEPYYQHLSEAATLEMMTDLPFTLVNIAAGATLSQPVRAGKNENDGHAPSI